MKEYTIRPSHYGGDENPFEPRKIEAHYDLGFNLGNVLKYVLRYKKKGGIEDLKKALTYIVYEIERDFGFMVFITRAKDCDVFIERLKSVKKKSLDELNTLIKKLENLDRNCNYTKQAICLIVGESMINPYYVENPCSKSLVSSKNFLLWED